MNEFDPTSEKHFHLLTVKAVEPGCTTELQIEMLDGTLLRFTTTDISERDDELFERQVLNSFRAAWRYYLEHKE